MSNFVIFGSTQSGKSTLAGYIASASLTDDEFVEAVSRNQRYIEKMGIGPMTREMIFVSFASLDRDELRRFGQGANTIGTTKRTHRKSVFMSYERLSQNEKLIMIDTPGVRSESKERYMGIFEGDIGICMINISDLEKYHDVSSRTDSESITATRMLDRKLFDPIRFWCAYKRIQDLVIAISKIDIVEFDEHKIRCAVNLVREKLTEFGLDSAKIPIIPISIRARYDGDVIKREVYNVAMPNMYPHEYSVALLHEVEERGLFSNYDSYSGFLASISNLCKIKDGNGYAFRVKVLRNSVSMTSQIVVGPLKHIKTNTLHYITGRIKSLKDEYSHALTSTLAMGSIGGVSFGHVYDSSYKVQPPSSKLNPVEEYKVLRTTVMVSGEFVKGNAVTLRVPEDELGESSFIAMNELLPKECLSFFWFGKRIVADVVELYHEANSWFITLCPLTVAYLNATGFFTVPYDYSSKKSALETLVVVPLVQRDNNPFKSYSNYINFTVSHVSNVSIETEHIIRLEIDMDDFDYLCEDFELRFEPLSIGGVLHFSQEESSIILSNIKFDELGKVLKVIRQFLRENGITGYNLRMK